MGDQQKTRSPQGPLSLLLVVSAILLPFAFYVRQLSNGQEHILKQVQENNKMLIEQQHRLQEIEFKLQQQEDPKILEAAERAVARDGTAPVAALCSLEKGRIKLGDPGLFRETDTFFGVSMRNDRALTNHGMRVPSSYDGELIHPLADRFVLIQYRRTDFEQNGQRVNGLQPFAVCAVTLTPIDKSE